MKATMEFCRRWFAPLTVAPLIVVSVAQDNLLAFVVCLIAVIWASLYATMDRLFDNLLGETAAVVAILEKIKNISRGVPK